MDIAETIGISIVCGGSTYYSIRFFKSPLLECITKPRIVHHIGLTSTTQISNSTSLLLIIRNNTVMVQL